MAPSRSLDQRRLIGETRQAVPTVFHLQRSWVAVTGAVAWCDPVKQLGFVALSNGHGDAFEHISVIKEAGYVGLLRGTTVWVRIEEDRSKRRVAQVLATDTNSAQPP